MKANLRTRAAVTAGIMLGGITMLLPGIAFSQSASPSNIPGHWNAMALKAGQASPPQILAQIGPPQLQVRYVEVASVISEPRPSSGQRNRSSGNFSIGSLPSGTNTLYWQVVRQDGQAEIPGILFNVMQDRSAASDPVVFGNLTNKSTSSVSTSRSFYIANPRGATENFIVKVYAVYFQ